MLLLLGYLAAVTRTALGWAEWWADEFGFLQQCPSCPLDGTVITLRVGYDGVGASVHHACVEAVGHGEGLEV